MKKNQKSMFDGSQGPPSPNQVKHCERCHVLCRVVSKKNPNAQVFVKGTMQTGRFCTNCLVVDFLLNFDLGPASSLGKEYMTASKTPPPGWNEARSGPWEKAPKFDPQSLRAPHIQEQFGAIVAAAAQCHGAELTVGEIDWYEVIANWHLPFPDRRGKKP